MKSKQEHYKDSSGYLFIKGESASGGVVYSKTTTFKRTHGSLHYTGSDPETVFTLDDFYRAVQKTSDQLMEFQNRLAEQLIESASLIFSAHLMILKDARFINEIAGQIMSGISPPTAVRNVAQHYIDIFSSSSHAYIKEKVNDIEDLAGRILKNMFNWTRDESDQYDGRIVIAQDLYPSEILKLASENVKGIILVRGGITSHVSILSRSLKIPLVIANDPVLQKLSNGTPLLMDGDLGNIYIRPKKEIIEEFEHTKVIRKKISDQIGTMLPETRTLDGEQIHLMANINLLCELELATQLKAEGIGLYRTEFPFLIRNDFPTEEEQYPIYKRLFDQMKDKEVTIRTLDFGGEKLPYDSFQNTPCVNPALGLRSIRFTLKYQNILEQQLRAILRAGANAPNMRIMFPLISSLDEFIKVKQIVKDCMTSLEKDGYCYHRTPQIGMMVEIPSVVEIIRELCGVSDFFSIGTNDFIQYMLAVDRSNDLVADYYCPHHPSVLRALARVVRIASEEQKDVAICGEMANNLVFLKYLIGIGVRTFSVAPQFLPGLQKRIGEITIRECQQHAAELLQKGTIQETYQILYSS